MSTSSAQRAKFLVRCLCRQSTFEHLEVSLAHRYMLIASALLLCGLTALSALIHIKRAPLPLHRSLLLRRSFLAYNHDRPPPTHNVLSEKRHAYTISNDRLSSFEETLAACDNLDTASIDVGSRPTITELNQAISTAGRCNRPEDALKIFKSIPKFDLYQDLRSYNNIIWSLGHCNHMAEARRIFNELCQSRRFEPNAHSYGSLLYGFARSGSYKEALHYLEDMVQRGVQPNHVVLSSVMEACTKAGQHGEALRVMNRMEEFGVTPDVAMINTAVKSCAIAGAMDEAEQFANALRSEQSMDVLTFHTLMMGHIKSHHYARVLLLYDEALAANIELDGGIFSLAMLAAHQSEQHERVLKIAERARAAHTRLTEASYTVLIQALGELGQAEAALACLDTMRGEGLAPNTITYTALFTACRVQPSLVPPLLLRMRREGAKVNTIVLTAAINTLTKGDKECVERALRLYEEMEANGPAPNLHTYNTVIRTLTESSRLEEALGILERIAKRGLQPDNVTFTTLLSACGSAMGDSPASGPSGNSASNEVNQVVELMRQANLQPDGIVYGAALEAYRRAGSALGAVTLLNEMRSKGVQPTAGHHNTILRTLQAQGHVEKMMSMLIALAAQSQARLNSNSFELVLEALLGSSKWKEALLVLRTMDQHGHRPSTAVCVHLVEILEKERQYKAALALYNYMERKGYDFYANGVLNEIFKRLVKVAAFAVNNNAEDPSCSVLPLVGES